MDRRSCQALSTSRHRDSASASNGVLTSASEARASSSSVKRIPRKDCWRSSWKKRVLTSRGAYDVEGVEVVEAKQRVSGFPAKDRADCLGGVTAWTFRREARHGDRAQHDDDTED